MTAQSPTAPQPTPVKKRSWLKKLAWLALGSFIVVIVAIWIGFEPLTLWAMRKTAKTQANVDLEALGLDVGLFSGSVALNGLSATRGETKLLGAKEVAADMSITGLIAGRVEIDEIRLIEPDLTLVRTPDGSIGLGGPPEADSPGASAQAPPGVDVEAWRKKLEEEAAKRDLVQDLQRLAENLKKWSEEQAAKAGQPGVGEPGDSADPDEPQFLVRRLLCENAAVTIEDRGPSKSKLKLVRGTVEITNLVHPAHMGAEPTQISVRAGVHGAPEASLEITGTIDLRGDHPVADLTISFRRLPMTYVDNYVSASLPVTFGDATTVDLTLPANFNNYEIDWRPMVKLANVDMQVRDPENTKRLLGLDAKTVVRELSRLSEIELTDARIHGPIWSPNVDVGETLTNLVLEGAKAYATERANEEIDKGKQKLNKALGKEQRRLDKKTSKLQGKLDKELNRSGLKGTGLGGAANDATKKLLGGLLGGKKKGADDKDKTPGETTATANPVIEPIDEAVKGVEESVKGALEGLFGPKKKDK